MPLSPINAPTDCPCDAARPAHHRALVPALAALLLSLAAAPLRAQQAGRPDQLYVFNERTQTVNTVTGHIKDHGLDKVRVELGDKERSYDSLAVRAITWGQTSADFKNAGKDAEKGDFENAVAKYRQAATDSANREPVRAAARARAARALAAWGAADPAYFGECVEACTKFLSDHSTDRLVPEILALQARATWLSGEASAAAVLYRTLFESGSGAEPTPGYPRLLCLSAGLSAGRAATAAGDTMAARDVYSALQTSLASLLSAALADDPQRASLERLSIEAGLGEGFVQIASGQASQALNYFQGKANSEAGVQRYAAGLGLAQALFAAGRDREAMIWFARVSALEAQDRDRNAEALLGLARCALRLSDTDASTLAKNWLGEVVASYGDTPAAGPARELSKTL
ncbi:MAG: hypothetical protein QF724_03665 [Planctomycetota bacterium]|jgi:hypothetical protein|nr:hypothetical protein [Planctomycetota bacterium]MDP6520628.1 hypothetical protein [Planctomycetota bacterium]MDP6838011.1 hypothetical protein [Planctomycetota bacterium]MDP6955212.1 hypothetical protein [Planctomycetota bacterium]